MIRKSVGTIAGGVFFAVLLFSVQCFSLGKGVDAPRISKEQLRTMLGRPDVVLLDVRIADEWKNAKEKIQGAVRFDPNQSLDSLALKYPKDKILVFYCS
jgi:hypothetical protein